MSGMLRCVVLDVILAVFFDFVRDVPCVDSAPNLLGFGAFACTSVLCIVVYVRHCA